MQSTNSALSEHLLSTLPVSLLGHFTFQRRASEQRMDTVWNDFVTGVNITARQPFGWIRADEIDDYGNKHIHAAFVSFAPISDSLLADTWNTVNHHTDASNALIQPYDSAYGTSGINYLLKDDCISLSGNLFLYSSLTDVSSLNMSERRNYHRIRS